MCVCVCVQVKVTLVQANRKRQYFLITFVLCSVVALAVLIVVVVYVARRHAQSRQKLAQLAEAGDPTEASKNLQVGCCCNYNRCTVCLPPRLRFFDVMLCVSL